MTTLRALGFGDVEGNPWGAAWLPDPAWHGPLAVRAGDASATIEVTLEGAERAQTWALTGDGASLSFAPLGPPAGDGQGPPDGFDQLCSVKGQLSLEGAEHAVDCLGWRSSRSIAQGLEQIESFRQLSAWFQDGEGIALLAVRPPRSRGHDADVVTASVLDREQTHSVADPRLSTAYTSAGLPARAGLELWIDAESADAEDEEPQYPRRAAGEAVGAGLGWAVDGFELHAQPLRWHSRGSDGAGLYLLGRRR
jgi:hypothetical protein